MSGHISSLRHVAKIALAGVVIGLGALATATQANAQPAQPLPPPAPGEAPPQGQPVMVDPGAQPVAAPAPPPIGAPPVPEIANQQYGQGSRPGPLGFLRDAWNMAQNPYDYTGTMQPGDVPAGRPPPGAGPAPQLPPGYQSLTDPASSGPAPARTSSRAGRPCRRVTTRSPGHRRPDTSLRRPTRMCGSPSTRMRCPRPGPLHRGPDAYYASAGMTSRSNSSTPVRSYAASGK